MIKRELNKEHGKRLKECLDNAGMTQKELAEKANCTPQFISNVINGKRNMSIQTAEIFAEILQVKSDYLLGTSIVKTDEEAIKWAMTSIVIRNNAVLDILDTTSNIRLRGTIFKIQTPDGKTLIDYTDVPANFRPYECMLEDDVTEVYNRMFVDGDAHEYSMDKEIDIPDGSKITDIKMQIAIVDLEHGTEETKIVPYGVVFDLIYEIVDYIQYKCDRFEEVINTRVWE